MRTPRLPALASAILWLTLAASAIPPAQATEPFDGEFGLLLGVDRADPDVAGLNGKTDLAPLFGLRWASRIGTPTNWFLDGVYAQHQTALGENSKLVEVRTGLEHLMPIGTGDTSWFLAGAVGAASYDFPTGLEDVNRPLISGGVGLAQQYSSGIFRAELRAEQLVGDNGFSGAAVTNLQLLLGWSFGLRSPKPDSGGDRDGDGVRDADDACPDTPAGARVDARGCPIDSDGDGVFDGIDRCPDTPPGTKVDAWGCPLKRKALFEEKKKTLVLEGVNFRFDSAELTNESSAILDDVAASLKDWPEVRVEVGGHTDSMGEDAYNQSLSERRAGAVRDYLISKGIAADRLTARGYGESQPISDNATAEGRAKNRRVELTKLD